MAGFDTSIFRQERVQPLDPVNALMRGLQVQGAMQGNALQSAQMQFYQQQKALELAKAQEEASGRNALARFRANMPDPQAAAVATLGGDRRPTPENAARIPQVDPRIAQATMAFKAGMIPYADFQKIAYPDRKVARTQEIDDGKGGKMIVQWDEQGNRMGESAAGYVAPVQVNQGDRATFVRPQAGVSLPMFMSPEQRDSSARGWANISQSDRHFNQKRADDAARPPGGNAKTGPMSVTLQKELLESDDTVQSAAGVVRSLKAALKQNDGAYSGYLAKPRAVLRSNLPGQSPEADATIDIDNLMTGQGLESLKAIFGAAPTEGERKILMDMQASVDKTPAQRKAIMDRAVSAAERRAAYAASKAAAIRDGSYLTDGVPAQPADSAASGLSPQEQAELDQLRARFGKGK